MGMIKGTKVILYEKKKTGVDGFNKPIYKEEKTEVENVLVEPISNDDLVNDLSITGKKEVYRLCIPKGDNHNFLDTKVEFFGKVFKTYGFYTEYIEDNVPLEWNRKVMCENYG